MLVVVFTLINSAMLIFNSGYYFLFSAYIPYYLTGTAMFLCGRFPAEYYTDMADFEFFDQTFFVVAVVISAVIMLLYLLCWLLSKNHRVGWLIFALVMFAADTAAMFVIGGIALDSIIDILFHAWVIYYLGAGIYAHFKLKKLQPEETGTPTPEADAPTE